MRRRPLVLAGLLLAAALCATAALAQDMAVQLDPAQTHVDFVLGDILHTVHGDFHLKNGLLRFDKQTGAASGQLTVDATTGESGSKSRDRKMHRQVLESAKFPDIIFQPQRVIGKIAPAGSAQMEIEGLMTMHGQTHPVTAGGPVQVNGNRVSADLKFTIPYQNWGIKNPSTLFLRVSDKVEITVHAMGQLTPAVATTSAQAASH